VHQDLGLDVFKMKRAAEDTLAADAIKGHKTSHTTTVPPDAKERQAAKPVICYRVDCLPSLPNSAADAMDAACMVARRCGLRKVSELTVPPRDGMCFTVRAGCFFRIISTEGPQVGDLNLWNADNLLERFYASKTRQLHATHVSTGDRLWSCMPYMRPMATITHDTLGWYGWDTDGAGVHDVIGSRCDPYTNHVLKGANYNNCCHSNLTRALATFRSIKLAEAEPHVHDVLNVFMCTGFTKDTHQYFMKASPVRPGDYIEFFAEIDLIAGLSACPGGDCSASHSDDVTKCYPLRVEIFEPQQTGSLDGWHSPAASGYSGGHGVSTN